MNPVIDIGAAAGKTRVNFSNGTNQDIINTIHREFSAAAKETESIAHYFKGKTDLETAYNIWSFLKNKIDYKVDGKIQKIRLPKRFLGDQLGDCKSFSLFTAAILHNLGMPFKFRYASYSSSPTPGHVYVLTKDESNNDIIIDGVWERFDDEKKYTHKKDYSMRIETLSGIDGIGKRKGRLKKKLKEVWDKVKGTVKKTNPVYVVGRQAFLGLVKLNVRGFASRLSGAIAKDRNKAVDVWENKLGGKFGSLTKAVETGKNKKAIMPKRGVGINGIDPEMVSGIGDPVTVGTALLTAAPIILIIISKLLKPLGLGNDPAMDDAVADANDNMEQEVDEDEIDNLASGGLNPKGGGKGGSFSLFAFDFYSPLCWANFITKGAIILTATSQLF